MRRGFREAVPFSRGSGLVGEQCSEVARVLLLVVDDQSFVLGEHGADGVRVAPGERAYLVGAVRLCGVSSVARQSEVSSCHLDRLVRVAKGSLRIGHEVLGKTHVEERQRLCGHC
jgi:hypothetical protein